MNKNARPNTISITASNGVKQNDSIRYVITRADKVLYEAKDNGRN
ncbi:diguanylate cyclase [Vibrio gigantis]|uniref:Diguanylate cyclase n=1 Tax=Vibrio gigantis TaxID=296199 RepID=A0A5M9P452_9VIBR|nr:diguanylate cyclase [Vibrio gigantis]